MVVTLGQQYNIGEKPTVVYCTLTLIAMQGHQKNIEKKKNSTSNTVVIIYCYIGCEDEVTTLKREQQRGPMM